MAVIILNLIIWILILQFIYYFIIKPLREDPKEVLMEVAEKLASFLFVIAIIIGVIWLFYSLILEGLGI